MNSNLGTIAGIESPASGRGRLVAGQHRRLRWFGIIAGGMLVFLVVLRLWWGWEADRRLQAELDRYRAAGQPVYAAEFDAELDAVRDDQNAALLLESAFAGITFATPSGVSYDQFLSEPDAFDAHPVEAEQLYQSNANVFQLVRRARAMPQVAWKHRLQGASFVVPPVSQQRSLAKLLWFAINHQYRTGDHAGAIETTHDLAAFSETVNAHPVLISSLVGWACEDLGLSTVEEFGARLVIEPAVGAGEGVHPASRAQVEALINRLLAEDDAREAAVRMYYGDRATYLAMLDTVPGLSGWDRVVAFLERPIIVLDTIRALQPCSLAADAVRERNWPRAAAHFPGQEQSRSLLRLLTRPVSQSALGGTTDDTISASVRTYYARMAQRRLAATALAIRLFELDQGHRPERLDALVPAYLSVVPADPLSQAAELIRYNPAAVHPLVYSVGRNGVDDGGRQSIRPEHRIDFDRSDILFYLDGKPKDDDGAGDSSAQTIENNEDGEDDKRQADENEAGQGKP